MKSLINKVTEIDAINGLDLIPDEYVNCIVTSPPYWGLRDYGDKVFSEFPEVSFSIFGLPITIPEWKGQLGLEPDPMMFVGHIVYIFRKAKRVLRNDGVMWLNFGDTYAGYWGNKYGTPQSFGKLRNKNNYKGTPPKRDSPNFKFYKPKDLMGIPWTVALALRDDGWYLRQDIIWSKPNPMPESVTDRCTKAHEYIFMLSKSKKYFYDAEAIKTPPKESSISRWNQNIVEQNGSDRIPGKKNGNMKAVGGPLKNLPEGQMSMGANKRSVWEVATKPFSDAHFATYPDNLIIDCIKAGCPVGGVVLDPFSGSNTTGIVAKKLNRNYVAFEINPDYKNIYENRTHRELGLFQ